MARAHDHMTQPAIQEHYLKQLDASSRTGGAFVQHLRREAFQRFAESGFPTTRNEEWKYTDVTPIARTPFRASSDLPAPRLTREAILPFLLGGLDAHLLVFVNGRYMPELSSPGSGPAGITAGQLAPALARDGQRLEQHLGRVAETETNAFTALNMSLFVDGALILIPEKTVITRPVHLLYVSSGSDEFAAHTRNLIVVGRESQASVIESYAGTGPARYFTNAVTEISLGENAKLDYLRLEREGDEAYHIGSTYARLDRNALFASTLLATGARLSRNNFFVTLDGEGAETVLNGLYLGTGSQHIDNHTTIDHAKPHCPSHELYKGILAGKSRGVFNGKIKVRKDAQKTDARQTNKNLILSDEASVDTKPQLEIFANDVKCTHGATIGQLDDEQLFYLRSRGVDLASARDMLIYAFASDVVEKISNEAVRPHLREIIHDRLAAARQ